MTQRHEPQTGKIDFCDKDKAQRLLSTGPQPGELYTHYKGGRYEVVCRSVDEGTLEQLVTYKSLNNGGFWTRTVANFTQLGDGTDWPVDVPRFQKLI